MVILAIASNHVFEKNVLVWKRAINHLKILNFHIYTNNKKQSQQAVFIYLCIYITAYSDIIKRGYHHETLEMQEKLDGWQHGRVGERKRMSESDAILFQL